jgi:hypothetical protein
VQVRDTDAEDPFRNRTVMLLDDFKLTGVHGTHVCMVFEVLGCHLLKLIIRSQYHGIPIRNIKVLIREVSLLIVLSTNRLPPRLLID